MIYGLFLMAAVWLALWLFVMLVYARPLAACWKEPVLRHPVLIIESDDWGAGPIEQADALARLADCLAGFRDRTGHPAVMTLGIILEVPDGERIRQDDCRAYHGQRLTAPVFAPIRTVMAAGIESGVLAPQIHGLTHYRPSTLLKLAAIDDRVREWLVDPRPAATEALPDALQSNWIDGAVLPPLPLADNEIKREVSAACTVYRELFGQPQVAVATTFIWNERVEQAWAELGVDTVITPGRRYTSRNAQGQPDPVDLQTHSGMISPLGLLYLVRDVYFEPARGHSPKELVDGLAARTALGRPTLVETHRFNFLGQTQEASMGALSDAMSRIMARWPQIRFLSSAALANVYRTQDPAWIDKHLAARARAWARRVREVPRFHGLARMTGLDWVLKLIGNHA